MLIIDIPIEEGYDEESEEFIVTKSIRLELEHSLVSLSKWEAKHKKPFLSHDEKTAKETVDYLKAMTLTSDFPDEMYGYITTSQMKTINDYITDKQTATWFREIPNQPRNREIITAELIYYWMSSLNIDLDWENRHLNRLITLVRVTNEKNQPPKKMDRAEMLRERDRINAERNAQFASGA